jgi:hypothetical protein
VALLWYAIRLARVADPSLALLGTGLAVSYVFFSVEEILAYSLRHTQGTILFWLLAGLTIAGWRMATVHEPVAQALPEKVEPERPWPRMAPVPVRSAIIGREERTSGVVTKA